ncbi:beta-mannosidase [Paenibacillus roseipurpureus]|uniref:Beta-mannosidase B n=1 Tax=Paenibacillus roseopurpureus TaxID=2918901 RepID=A0AA96LUF5_9BACL|nr:glycoside hydrolase family 2 protein [Paenibacillus sp. MBLB1832]WNR46213.1 glycoside hydrolase family 2 protein [Paenibacillus sp. MBLB1832]
MKRLDLHQGWQMKDTAQEAWLPAVVPGSVASDLLRAGAMVDPYFRNQQYEAFEVFRRDYEYVKQFALDEEMLQHANLELICEGLDTLAEIYVNGCLLAETRNMHRTYAFNLRALAHAGENELRIVFRSPVTFVENKQKESFLWAANDDYVVQGYPHLRKAHHMFGWDWGPKVPDSGIWRDIYVCAYDSRIADVSFTQEHVADQPVVVQANVTIERGQDAGLSLELVLVSPTGAEVAAETIAVTQDKEQVRFNVANPQLWWPNGLGEQPLYEVRVKLTGGREAQSAIDSREYRIGLRTLMVKREPDQWGETFEFEINGHSIFTMGANYIPEDNIRDRQSRARTEKLIKDCVSANFNCIRVWGGGFYPDDYFFDLCDEYGLIVWQDHLFACAEYEMTAEFTAEIRAEVADNVRRIRHHASLGIWCGNNEMEWAWVEWDFPKRSKLKTDYIKQFEIVIPEVTQAHDAETFYWLASPSSGGGFDDPNASERGDVHYWQVWHGNKPFTEYRKHYFRFCSEFGYQSFPSLKTIKAVTNPEDRNIFSAVMEGHQKNAGGNSKILSGISENFLYPKDFDSLLYVSQLLQAEAMRYGVEHWRRNRGRCMGSVYWQLNDCWPVASWSSLDYFGRWKALHYAAKRFYAPLIVSAEETGTRVKLTVTNDTLALASGHVEWRLREVDGTIIRSGVIDTEVEPLSASCCAEFDFAEDIRGREDRAYLEYAWGTNEGIVSEGYVLFVKPKHLALQAQPGLRVSIQDVGEDFNLLIEADSLALFVELDFQALDAQFSNNYFHVSAGQPKRIVLHKSNLSSAATLEELKQQVKIRSLVDSF